jgi:hypothetical protein
VLSSGDEAIIVAFRKHTLLRLDDCLYVLQATIPHLTRSSLHRCLQRKTEWGECVATTGEVRLSDKKNEPNRRVRRRFGR